MRLPQLVAAASAALLLTACGGGDDDAAADRTGPEVAAAAADALEEAGSVHVEGSVSQDGGEVSIDLQLQGDDAAGTVAMNGVEVELIAVDGAQYVRTGADFWASSGVPQEVAATLDGQWVALPADASSDFSDLTLAGIVDGLRDPGSPIRDEVGEDEIDGQDVLVVEQEDGSRLFVSADDPAYPLRLTNEGEQGGSMDLGDFGEEQDITAPEGALDLTQLRGTG
ncbi:MULTISPECIES: hypothetical protein [unclassified Blastococcus]